MDEELSPLERTRLLQHNMPIPVYNENPLLNEVMEEFDFNNPSINLVDAIQKMRMSLASCDNGYALAANQIGIKLRAFIIKEKEYINPRIIKSIGIQTSSEGCLSFPDLYIERSRPARIWVKYYDITGKSHSSEYTGIKAVAFSHELDHLNGKTFLEENHKVIMNE